MQPIVTCCFSRWVPPDAFTLPSSAERREVCNPPPEQGSLEMCVGLHIGCKLIAQGRVLNNITKILLIAGGHIIPPHLQIQTFRKVFLQKRRRFR